MKREVITTGKNIDDAIEAAVAQLGVDRDDVSVEIIDTPSRGFLGLGGSLAKVRVWVGEDEEPAAPVKEKPAAKEDKKSNKKRVAREKKEAPAAPAPAVVEMDEEEAQVAVRAKTYFEDLCAIMGLDRVSVTVTPAENKTLRVALTGDGLGVLIGKRGETMYAIQYLASLALNKKEGQFIRIELDIEGYRAKRTEALQKLALRMADKAVKQKRNVALEYMQAYERRVIHATLQGHAFVTTRSVGEEPFRKVIITYNQK